MQNTTSFVAGRRFDIVCLGRLAVDFYAQQIGARLEDVTSFAKYLGGSSANTAFGCARLGPKAAMASRVGDDAMGNFLVETLAREGCDVSHVSRDPARLREAATAREVRLHDVEAGTLDPLAEGEDRRLVLGRCDPHGRVLAEPRVAVEIVDRQRLLEPRELELLEPPRLSQHFGFQ